VADGGDGCPFASAPNGALGFTRFLGALKATQDHIGVIVAARKSAPQWVLTATKFIAGVARSGSRCPGMDCRAAFSFACSVDDAAPRLKNTIRSP